jgi:hypothetical protein
MSLGMTNAILKRLVLKGYLSIRKVNNRNIAYAVTPAGVEAIAKRSYRYLRRTIGSIVRYKEAIEGLVRKVRAWLRETIGIAYDPIRTGDQVISFTLFSETVDPPESASRELAESGASYAYPRQVLID